MGKRLYVGNMPYDITEDSIRSTFESCGAVESVKIITDKFTGRSKGFGFVEMADDAGAQSAIQKLHKSKMGDRDLTVNEARPMENSGARNGSGGYNGARERQPSYNR